jgi:hypothetical protein
MIVTLPVPVSTDNLGSWTQRPTQLKQPTIMDSSSDHDSAQQRSSAIGFGNKRGVLCFHAATCDIPTSHHRL